MTFAEPLSKFIYKFIYVYKIEVYNYMYMQIYKIYNLLLRNLWGEGVEFMKMKNINYKNVPGQPSVTAFFRKS